MIVVLDKNVASETLLDAPQNDVLGWMDSRPAQELFMMAVTEAEVPTGTDLLPEGACRQDLASATEPTPGSLFAKPVLPFAF